MMWFGDCESDSGTYGFSMGFAEALKMGSWVCHWIYNSDSERDCYGLCIHVC